MEYSPMMVLMLWALTPSDCLEQQAVVEEVPRPAMTIAGPSLLHSQFTFNGGRPFLLETDPQTGRLHFNVTTTPLHHNFGPIDRKDTSHTTFIAENSINPGWKESFADPPVQYSEGKFPLISSSYANTKVQGHGSTGTYSNHKPYPTKPSTPTPSYYTHKAPSPSSPSTTTTAAYDYEYVEYDYEPEPVVSHRPIPTLMTTTTTTTTTTVPPTTKSTTTSTTTTTTTTPPPTTTTTTSPRPIVTSMPIDHHEEPENTRLSIKLSTTTNRIEPVTTNNQILIKDDDNWASEVNTVEVYRPSLQYGDKLPKNESQVPPFKPMGRPQVNVSEFEVTRRPPQGFIQQFSNGKPPGALRPVSVGPDPRPSTFTLVPQNNQLLKVPKDQLNPTYSLQTSFTIGSPSYEEENASRPVGIGQVLFPDDDKFKDKQRPPVQQPTKPPQRFPDPLPGGSQKFPEVLRYPEITQRYPDNVVNIAQRYPEPPQRPELQAGSKRPTDLQTNLHRHPDFQAGPPRSPDHQLGPPRLPDVQVGPLRLPELQSGPPRHPELQSGPSRLPDHQNGPSRVPDLQNGPQRLPDLQNGPQRLPDIQVASHRPTDGPQRLPELKPGVHQRYPDHPNKAPPRYPEIQVNGPPRVPEYSSIGPQRYPDNPLNGPHRHPELPQRYPESKPASPQRYPEGQPGIPQRYPENQLNGPQRYPENPSNGVQRYPDSQSSPTQRFPENQPGPPQRYPENQAGIPQRYPEKTGPQRYPEGEEYLSPPGESYPRPPWQTHLKPPYLEGYKRPKPNPLQRHDLPNILPQFRPNAKVGAEYPYWRPPRPQQAHRRQGTRVTTLQMMHRSPPRRAVQEKKDDVFIVYPQTERTETVVVGTRGERPLPPDDLEDRLDAFPLDEDRFSLHRADTPVLKSKTTKAPPKAEFPYEMVKPEGVEVAGEYTAYKPTTAGPTAAALVGEDVDPVPYLQDYSPYATKPGLPQAPVVPIKPLPVLPEPHMPQHALPQSQSPTPQDLEAPFQASLSEPSRGWAVVTPSDEPTTAAPTTSSSPAPVFDPDSFKPELMGGFKPILTQSSQE